MCIQTVLSHGHPDLTVEQGAGTQEQLPFLRISTFNILAPIFKSAQVDGVGFPARESEIEHAYMSRNTAILQHLQGLGSHVICLQELWVQNAELLALYQGSMEGYTLHALERTGARGDGVACLVREGVEVLDRQDMRFQDLGGRVAMMLRLRLPSGPPPVQAVETNLGSFGNPGGQGAADLGREVILVNTHLLFPHHRWFSILRLREVKKLLGFLEWYTRERDCRHLPIVLCGDLNGETGGDVYNYLHSRNFTSAYEVAHPPPPQGDQRAGTKAKSWVSHRNHNGQDVDVDYIWYLNPKDRHEPLDRLWKELVFESTKQRIIKAYYHRHADSQRFSLAHPWSDSSYALSPVDLADAAASVEGDGTYSADVEKMRLALQELGKFDGFELSDDEVTSLLALSLADDDFLMPMVEVSGPVLASRTLADPSESYFYFDDLGQPAAWPDEDAQGKKPAPKPGRGEHAGWRRGEALQASWASLHPPELETGRWPVHYDLSDHGSLTAEFHLAAVHTEARQAPSSPCESETGGQE